MFDSEAVSAPGSKASYIELDKLRSRRNPEVSRVIGELDMVMDYLNFSPASNPNRLTKEDT